MTEAQFAEYLQALLGSVFTRVVMPTMLMVIAVVSVWVLLARANKNPKFNLYEVLLDERGKVSSQRVTMLGAFVVSSWALCVVTLNSPDLFAAAYIAFLGTWGAVGAATAIYRHKYPAPDGEPPKDPP